MEDPFQLKRRGVPVPVVEALSEKRSSALAREFVGFVHQGRTAVRQAV
jgi:hypothetical protein